MPSLSCFAVTKNEKSRRGRTPQLKRSSWSAYSSTSLPATPRCPSLSFPSRHVTNILRAVPLFSRKKRESRSETYKSETFAVYSSGKRRHRKGNADEPERLGGDD